MSNTQRTFSSFIEAKKFLIANPGGSIVRLDNNEGFYIKLPSNRASEVKKNDSKPIYSESDIKSIVAEKAAELDREKIERKKRIEALKEIEKLATPKKINYNKEPLKNSYPKKKPQKAEADFKRYIDEPTGSREDFKKMRGKQHFGNKTGNH